MNRNRHCNAATWTSAPPRASRRRRSCTRAARWNECELEDAPLVAARLLRALASSGGRPVPLHIRALDAMLGVLKLFLGRHALVENRVLLPAVHSVEINAGYESG